MRLASTAAESFQSVSRFLRYFHHLFHWLTRSGFFRARAAFRKLFVLRHGIVVVGKQGCFFCGNNVRNGPFHSIRFGSSERRVAVPVARPLNLS